MFKWAETLKQEMGGLGRTEALFLFFTMVSGFFVAMEYSITRPAVNALFITAFGPDGFPLVWLVTVPLNFAVVWAYNRALPRIGPYATMMYVIGSIILMNCLAPLIVPRFPLYLFLQYAWKEIYILLMYKQLWSMIHTTVPASRAKVLYGVLYMMGPLGSMLGSSIPSFFATSVGSIHLFWSTALLYSFIALTFHAAYQKSLVPSFQREVTGSAGDAIRMIGRNRLLLAVLLLVVFMQVTAALADFRFQYFLHEEVVGVDNRTELSARVFGAMNTLSLIFQFVGGFLLVHWVGLRNAHFAIPAFLLTTCGAAFALPTFGVAAAAFALTKSIDFSLFGVIREMLWVPLKLDEKYRAKAVIDVFAYRTSKALASFLVLGLQLIPGVGIIPLVNGLSLFVFLLWLVTVAYLLPKGSLPQAVN